MSKDNGGQAFPRAGFSGPAGLGRPVDGMSLRDYFAAKAMTYILESCYEDEPEAIAREAYLIADAMLKEREK